MTLTSDRACASGSAAYASIARSRPQSWRRCRSGRPRRRWRAPGRGPRALGAAMLAADQAARATDDVRQTVSRELEAARYEAALAARRHELVDPAKRHVARKLEARWNTALERVTELEHRLADLVARAAAGPTIDRGAARDLTGGMHYDAQSARRPRKTNRWPECGSRRSVSCTSRAKPSKPLRMSV